MELLQGLDTEAVQQLQDAVRGSAGSGDNGEGASGVDVEQLLERVYASIRRAGGSGERAEAEGPG